VSTTMRTLDTLDGLDFTRFDRLFELLGGFDPSRCISWAEDDSFVDENMTIHCVGEIMKRFAEVEFEMFDKKRPSYAEVYLHLQLRDGDTSRSALRRSVIDAFATRMIFIPRPRNVDPATMARCPDCFDGDDPPYDLQKWNVDSTGAFRSGLSMHVDPEGFFVIVNETSPQFTGGIGMWIYDCRVMRDANE
jgi:hypothetical protein